jgi:hypothetical protein
MKQLIFVGLVTVAVVASGLSTARLTAQTANAGTSLGTVNLTRSVTLGGQRLAAGAYQVRLTNDAPQPGVGQSPDAEKFVEFLRAGKVVGREVATVVSNADIGTIAKGKRPAAGASSVELLKGNDYLRVWINRGGQNYLIHLPVAS